MVLFDKLKQMMCENIFYLLFLSDYVLKENPRIDAVQSGNLFSII